MAKRLVRLYGDPVLRKPAEPVTGFGDELETLAADMLETMKVEDGIGLAAPQVGVSLRFIVIGLPEQDDDGNERLRVLTLANPEIIEDGDEEVTTEEGCLSLPEIMVHVTRPAEITVRYQDLKGEEQTLKAADMLSVVIQHEMDHLDGVLITDYLPALKRSMMRTKLKKLEEQAKERMDA